MIHSPLRGESAQVKCELTHHLAFKGEAKAELMGLPPGTKTDPLQFTHESPELIFKVATDAKARKGLHRTLFCKLTLQYEGETLTQTLGGRGALRIDVPAPPEKPKPAKTASVPKK